VIAEKVAKRFARDRHVAILPTNSGDWNAVIARDGKRARAAIPGTVLAMTIIQLGDSCGSARQK
jgi:hypothetical protein